MRTTILLAAGCVCGLAGPARAGALAEVIGGLTNAAGESGSKGGGGDDGGDVVGAIVNGLLNGSDDWSWSRSSGDPTWVPPTYAPYPSTVHASQPTDIVFYAGFQSVENSDGSMTLELRTSYDDFGISVRGTGFYESVGEGPETQHLHLDLGSITALFRPYRDLRTTLWVEAGVSGVSTIDALHFFGVVAGARLERKLSGELAVSAEARYFYLEDSVTATELRATAHLSLLRVSYRRVDFNVGPPLQGPEVGVALAF